MVLYRENGSGSSELHNEVTIRDTNLVEVHNVTLRVSDDSAKRYYISANTIIYIDDVELVTLSE